MSECDLMPLRGGPASSGQTQIESETNRTKNAKKNKIKTKVMTRYMWSECYATRFVHAASIRHKIIKKSIKCRIYFVGASGQCNTRVRVYDFLAYADRLCCAVLLS